MEIIELNDWKYEIQYIDDMIRILNPFIRFKFNKDGELDIFKKGSGLLIEEKITTKEFINFIQYTFPEIVREEIEKEQSYEELKKQVFVQNYRNRFQRLTMKDREYYNQDQEDTFEEYFEMFKKMSEEEIKEQTENYGMFPGTQQSKKTHYALKRNYLLEKIEYLKNILSMIPHKLGTINNVLQFLENLQYSNSF